MPVEIHELTSNIEVMDRAGGLDPTQVAEIVQAVIKALKTLEGHEASHRAELDTRSIVDQQRGGRR